MTEEPSLPDLYRLGRLFARLVLGGTVVALPGSAMGQSLRLSDMGGTGDPSFAALAPAAAYNETTHEFLVAWAASDDAGGLAADELEIFVQRVDAATGGEMGANDLRISDMGGTGDAAYVALDPAVAYNDIENEFLVVWAGRDGSGDLLETELEIYGQRLDATTGSEVGANDFRISQMGTLANAMAARPAVAFNRTDNEYLVVWEGVTDGGADGLAPEELEIYGQRLAGATAAQVGPDDFRISEMGGIGSPVFAAVNAAVAWDSLANEYLVVWQGNQAGAPFDPREQEIWGQRLDKTGAEVGLNDFRISDMGGFGSPLSNAYDPAVAYNPDGGELLVVWSGTDIDDSIGMSFVGEQEIWGQRIAGASGAEVGSNDFRISDMGGTGDTRYLAREPTVAYSNGDYIVSWTGSDDRDGLLADELEVFGQWIDGDTGSEIGRNDFRISEMGGSGNAVYGVSDSAVVYGSASGTVIVIWQGDDDREGLVDEELEIFGLLTGSLLFGDGFESGSTTAWSRSSP